jgi:hypothetical protein
MNIYCVAFLLLLTVSSSSLLRSSYPDPKTGKAGTAKIVFKSTDGGQTWQDISKGLPENLPEDSIRGNSFFANDKGLFLKVGNGLYHSIPNATAPFWTKEMLPDEYSSIAPAKSGTVEYKYWGVNLKTARGTSVWSPMFEISEMPRIGTNFETASGTIFIGTSRGYYKTANEGRTWKHVHAGDLVGHLAESNGVLLGISMRKIIRSTDNGENWEVPTSADRLAFDVKPIKGGFVAITASSELSTRRLSTSYDGGKTWQPIDAAPQNKAFIDSIGRTWNNRADVQAFTTSITQIGENLFSIHHKGIFKSSDNGKTWKLLLPAVKDRFFNLFISGNVIYAIPRSSKGGC